MFGIVCCNDNGFIGGKYNIPLTKLSCFSVNSDVTIKGRLRFEQKGEETEVQIIPLSPGEVLGKCLHQGVCDVINQTSLSKWINKTCSLSHLSNRVENLTEKVEDLTKRLKLAKSHASNCNRNFNLMWKSMARFALGLMVIAIGYFRDQIRAALE